MSSSSQQAAPAPPPDPEREYNLISQLEMRIASAATDSKFETILSKFLPALLLKLASPTPRNRNLAIKVCQYINQRLKITADIKLPVSALVKTFREAENAFVRRFCLLFIEQGLPRLDVDEAIATLPGVLQFAVPTTSNYDATDRKMWTIAFDFLLEVLCKWGKSLPERGSKEDMALKDTFALSKSQTNLLVSRICDFLLYDPRESGPSIGISGSGTATNTNVNTTAGTAFASSGESSQQSSSRDEEQEDFKPVFDKNFRRRSEVVLPIANFLFTSIFTDQQRLIPAVIMAVDANASAVSMSDVMFKQCTFDLEADATVDALFALYKRAGSRPKLQTRILSILSRSQKSTTRTKEIMAMVEAQLLDAPARSSGGLEAAKLRAALFSYLTWTVRVGQSMHLASISVRLQDLLKEYIELQGWPTMSDTGDRAAAATAAEIELRAKAYESIGLLAAAATVENEDTTTGNTGKPTSSINNTTDGQALNTKNTRLLDLVTWLFTSLRCDTTREIRGSIEEAIGRVMNTVSASNFDEASTARLKELLLWNVLAAPAQEDPVYFLPTVNNTKYPAVRFANKCLPFSDVDARFIDVLALSSSTDRREIAEEGTRGLDPYWHVSNARMTTAASAQGGNDRKIVLPDVTALVSRFFGSSPEQTRHYENPAVLAAAVTFCRNVIWCDALKETKLAPEESADWKQTIDALVNNDRGVRRAIRTHLRSLRLEVSLPLARAALLGTSKASGECVDFSLELISLAPNNLIFQIQQLAMEAASRIAANSVLQTRAARMFGTVASLSDDAVRIAAAELNETASWKSAIGEELVKVQGHILRAAWCLTRKSLRGGLDPHEDTLQGLTQLTFDIIKTSTDKTLKETAYRCLRQLALCTPPTNGPQPDHDLLGQLISDGKKEIETAVSAAGPLLAIIHARGSESDFQSLLDRFLGLSEVRRPEFHFALGESLSVACAGFNSSSTMTEFEVDADLPSWGTSEALTTLIIDRVIGKCKTTKPSLKKAAAIWLLCIVQYCGDMSAVKARLRDCQAAFARLLNDRDEIVQETGSRGLGVVYEHGDKQLRDDLVRDLVQSFTGNNAKLSGTVDEDTQLFEAGALPTEKGESVTTYKDIVRLATEMGDPSLVYRFMNLASNNAIWNSRAAFGRFGLGQVLADSSYLSENKKFYPKLFRYRFDPNPNVQRSMEEIWRALVKDPNRVIQENFDLIMEDLLKSVVSGKEWRAREASCAAISDLVQGRDVEMFEKYLDEIWTVAFRVLDDVKETVRVAAMKLCRTLTSMLIRNLEVGEGNSKRSATMLNHAMPFLLQQMEGGVGKDVQQYAVVTLLEVVKKCPPKSLRPFAPRILETLVVSLSSLEHESINYLHLNADKYGLTAEKLDKMRVSSINASPVTEAIERCLDSITMQIAEDNNNAADMMQGIESTAGTKPNVSPMEDAMQRLVNAYRASIGLPSKVGLSRVMTTLVVRHPSAFRPYADKFVAVTRKHILDRNATISIAFSTSLGYLIRLASEKEVQATSKYAQKLYFESQELAHRAVAGEIIQAISKAANDVFMNHASAFLPFAFIGRHDTDKEVRERFDVPWKENIGGSRSINLYLPEIVDLISTHIKSPLWPIKHACSLAVAELVASMDVQETYNDRDASLLWSVVQEALEGKTWDGKEEVIKEYPKFVKQARSLWPETTQQMKKVAIREAKRTNIKYRPYAIDALGEFAAVREDLDLTQEVVSYLAELVVNELTDADAMEIDEEAAGRSFTNRTAVEATASAIVSCLFKVLASHPRIEVLDEAKQIVEKALAMQSRAVDSALYEGAKYFVLHAPQIQTKDGVHGKMEGCDNNKNASASNDARGTGSAPAMVGEASERRAEGDGRKDGGSGRFEPFEPLLMAVLAADSSRQGSEIESQRRSRVGLAQALAERGVQDPAAFTEILDRWLQTERSRPLREDMEKARQTVTP
ncbi:Proteasome component ECM29 [Exophiala dermatitidis]